MTDASALMKAAAATHGYGATTTVDESVEAPQIQPNLVEDGPRWSTGCKVATGLLVLLVLGVGVFFAAKHSTAVLEWQAEFVEEHHSLGIVLCIAVFLPWIVLCLPTTLYEILVGFMVRRPPPCATRRLAFSRPHRPRERQLCTDRCAAVQFGVWLGTLINASGKLIGSCTSFMLGKRCLAERVDRMAVNSWRVQRIKALLAEKPWRVAFIVRAAQIPIAIKNYGSSAADLRVTVFVTSCVVVDSLSGLAWAWIGSSAESLSSVFSGDAKQGGARVQQVMLIVGMVAAFAMVSGFGIWARRNLMGDGPQPVQHNGGDAATGALGGAGGAPSPGALRQEPRDLEQVSPART